MPFLVNAMLFCCAQVHIDKGVISAADLTAMIEELESYGSRGLGPRIIARAWVDPAFKVPNGYSLATATISHLMSLISHDVSGVM